jgi:hypothetical protein
MSSPLDYEFSTSFVVLSIVSCIELRTLCIRSPRSFRVSPFVGMGGRHVTITEPVNENDRLGYFVDKYNVTDVNTS